MPGQNRFVTLTSVISVHQGGVSVVEDAFPALTEEFARTGIAMLPAFLSKSLLIPLLNQLRDASYKEKDEVLRSGKKLGSTLFIGQDSSILSAFFFMLNRPELFHAASRIAGCDLPRSYVGRIHQTSAASQQHLDWHDDIYASRILGLNINLSAGLFKGGAFQLRNPDGMITREIQSWETGDAFLFRVSPGWQHRLTTVSDGERTVGVGWFLTQPDWADIMTHMRSTATERLSEGRP